VNWRIIGDHDELPNFAQASQNIAAAAVVLAALPEPAAPEELRDRDKLHIFLKCAMPQQAESSISRRHALSQAQPTRNQPGTRNVTVNQAQTNEPIPLRVPVKGRLCLDHNVRHTIDARRRDARRMRVTAVVHRSTTPHPYSDTSR